MAIDVIQNMFLKMLRLSMCYWGATRINRCTRDRLIRHGHVYVKFCVMTLMITIKCILKLVTDQIINRIPVKVTADVIDITKSSSSKTCHVRFQAYFTHFISQRKVKKETKLTTISGNLPWHAWAHKKETGNIQDISSLKKFGLNRHALAHSHTHT